MKMSKNNSLGDLIDNYSTLLKYKLGIEKPKKKKANTALIISLAGAALAVAGSALLLSGKDGKKNREWLTHQAKNVSNKTANWTNESIHSLNEATKKQIKELSK
ncbi:MAG: hypothetical protein ACOCWM_02480 [Cyclobacteriaceae bacterium]